MNKSQLIECKFIYLDHYNTYVLAKVTKYYSSMCPGSTTKMFAYLGMVYTYQYLIWSALRRERVGGFQKTPYSRQLSLMCFKPYVYNNLYSKFK